MPTELPDVSSILAKRLGHAFETTELVELALTHRSHSSKNYERLEFLGDSILGFTISAYLFQHFPELSEGELTRLRASLVRKESLAGIARDLDLGKHLRLGSGELKSGGFDRDSILADALEALFGAILVDGGIEAAREAILRVYQEQLQSVDPRSIQKDPKTRLQELLQKQTQSTPDYEVMEVHGEAHAQTFTVKCTVPGLDEAITGKGKTRRAAEQNAAKLALARLQEK
jgi:ribonuclease-3